MEEGEVAAIDHRENGHPVEIQKPLDQNRCGWMDGCGCGWMGMDAFMDE